MLTWTLRQIVMSILIIVLAHYIFCFLKDNLTTPKVKDMVNMPTIQYRNIYKNKEQNDANIKTNEDKNTKVMKDELANYLSELKNKKQDNVINNNTDNISSFPQYNSHFDNLYAASPSTY